MTEILTESFCERCGTRYTFESSAPRRSRVGRVRTFSRGVKNFVMSDEASFEEAMADARGEEELAATAHQLDAFHKTFNFCLTCRQYTCGECWNVTEGRCLTCAPIEGLQAPATHDHAAMAPGLAATNGHDAHVDDALEPDLWPEADLSQDRLERALGTETSVGDAIEDEVPSQLEVDAAAGAFDAPEFESTEGMTVDEAWMAAAAAEADAGAARDVRLPAPEPDAVVADAIDATAEVGAAEDVGAAGPFDEDAPIAAAAMATGFADDDEVPSMSARGAEEEADFEAQASAAEQDATAEAVMDPALDFDLDDAGAGVAGVAPGQSLEDAIAAYEARLAAEEAEAAGHADDHPVADVAAVAAIAAMTEPAAPVAAEPVGEATAEVPVEAAAVADAPVDLTEEPVAEAPAAVVAEPVVDDLPVQAADVASDEDHLRGAAFAAVVVDEPVAAADEPEDDHSIEAAALAAAAFAARRHHDEPGETVVVERVVVQAPEPEAAVEPEPVAVVEPEPVAAEPEPVAAEPEPVAASAEPARPDEPEWPAEPGPVAAEPVAAEPAPRDDVVPQPTWPTTPPPEPVAAPAPMPEAAPGTAPWLMVAPEEAARPEPQWPATPAWRASARNTDAPTTLAGRTLLPQPDATDLWAASAREVLSAPPVADAAVSATPQPCVQCGLSLSASARFCRRCGTRQA